MLKTVRRPPWKWRNVGRTARSPPGRTRSAATPAPPPTARMGNPIQNPTAQAKPSRPSITTQGWLTGAVSKRWCITKWMSLAGKVGFPALTLEKTVASEEEISAKHILQCTRLCVIGTRGPHIPLNLNIGPHLWLLGSRKSLQSTSN